jgi:hypothetical protein
MHRKSRCGSSLVESTLVLIVLLTLLFSIFDFGWVLFEHNTILHQARTAVRYAAINPGDLTAVQNVVLYGQATAPDGDAPGLFGLHRSMVDVSRADEWTPEDRIVITISGYRYTLITPFMAGGFTGRPIKVSSPVETQ